MQALTAALLLFALVAPYLRIIGEYQKSTQQYPLPKPVRLTEFNE